MIQIQFPCSKDTYEKIRDELLRTVATAMENPFYHEGRKVAYFVFKDESKVPELLKPYKIPDFIEEKKMDELNESIDKILAENISPEIEPEPEPEIKLPPIPETVPEPKTPVIIEEKIPTIVGTPEVKIEIIDEVEQPTYDDSIESEEEIPSVDEFKEVEQILDELDTPEEE